MRLTKDQSIALARILAEGPNTASVTQNESYGDVYVQAWSPKGKLVSTIVPHPKGKVKVG